MVFKVRVELLEATKQVAVYVKDEQGYLRVSGKLPNLEQQILRGGESPDPTLILSDEIARGIADALAAPAPADEGGELLSTLKELHKDDRATIAWMQAIIAKIVGMQTIAEEPVG